MRPIRLLVTAGPTREPIDPVRFITNYSTGSMGFAVAKEAGARGHKTLLITGPTDLTRPKNIRRIEVITAREMFGAVKRNYKNFDCIVMSAAVSDFRPAGYSARKIKRKSGTESISLKQNPDILRWLGSRRQRKMLVGFCMETEDLLKNAAEKMKSKNADIMVANAIDSKKSAFGEGRTSVVMLGPAESKAQIKNASKDKVAAFLLDKIEAVWYKKKLNN